MSYPQINPDIVRQKILKIDPEFLTLDEHHVPKGLTKKCNPLLYKLLYKGKKRYVYSRIRRNCRDWHGKVLLWGLTVKPGDYIGSCEGFNRKVESINYVWEDIGHWNNDKKNGHWFLYEIEFTSTSGRMHCCPGGGCAFPPETNEQIKEYWLRSNWSDPEPSWVKIQNSIREGMSFIDEFGEILASFSEYLKESSK